MRCSNSTLSTMTWSVATLGVALLSSTSLAQDECTTAVNVTPGTPAPFNTTTATSSAEPVSDAQCAATFLAWGTTNQDVWFKYTATQSGILTFSTCQSGSFDTSMVLYKGASCATMTQIACNGDGTGESGCQQYYSRIADISCAPGEIFYIRIGGYEGETGTGSLTATFVPVSSGCAGATGSCGLPHGGLGCSDPVCCAAVCALNPLCCEVAWDASCVQGAVDACGLFFYNCVPSGPANNCATNATLVNGDASLPFNTTGATTDGPLHTGSQCNSGNDLWPKDVWWRFLAPANGSATVTTCGTVNFDNKMAIYDCGTSWATYDFNTLPESRIGCIDDGASGTCFLTDGTTPYAAEISFNVQAGRWYLVRMASYNESENLAGTISFNLPDPCQLDAPTQAEAEACGSSTNNGCNAGGATEPILLGNTVSGTFWADNNSRDTDFYRLSVATGTTVTAQVKSASFARVIIFGGNITTADCAGVQVLATAAGSCPATATACLNAGEYYIFVGPANADGSAAFSGTPCGSGVFNAYSLKVTGTPATCPVTAATTCADPGPDTVVVGAQMNTITGGLVACAVNPAFPNCGTGGTTRNRYARVVPAAQVIDEVSCINFGVFAVRRQANATNTACANFASDLPLPVKIGVYRDQNGGAPTNAFAADGSCPDGNCDMVLIQEYDALVPGGAYKAVLNLAEPLCLSDVPAGQNLVIVMDCPDLYTGTQSIPGASGYGIRPGTEVAVTGANDTYCRLSCADTAAAYVLTSSVGASFVQNWALELNGAATGCSGGGNDCPADLNGDNVVNGFDLSAVLAGWGTPAGDTNGDGTTNGIDITTILSAWNTNCP